ncbi:hypothetical protein SAMN04488558_10667 [Ignavigranum ruoffiae]|uniref:DUF554 domain-containing protein n=1 Tax=Ignavigranum ruoffiae TaxID=89093 RepID=A0A1H9E1K6_9LACT|nr:DUF554 domain-containing protein [Ignavigranum ruoffiae]SEQ19447.1 hypothetical protein SAMN04488558_10667 [Ignavigranum ruoffiae]
MGAVINAIVVTVSGLIGLLLKKGIPYNLHQRLMEAIGLAIMAMGIAGIMQGKNTLVMILSMILGVFIGELLDIDARVIQFANSLGARLVRRNSASQIDWVQGFISGTMLTCVGSMSIIGALESGLLGNNTTLYTKSIIDAITSILLASSLGPGVVLSAFSVLILEGGLILGASFLSPLLPQPVISEVVCMGSILLVALGLNILEITKFKVLNFTPAIFMPILLMLWLG